MSYAVMLKCTTKTLFSNFQHAWFSLLLLSYCARQLITIHARTASSGFFIIMSLTEGLHFSALVLLCGKHKAIINL